MGQRRRGVAGFSRVACDISPSVRTVLKAECRTLVVKCRLRVQRRHPQLTDSRRGIMELSPRTGAALYHRPAD